MVRYGDWLRQAEDDLEWARHSLEGGFFAQTCFISQQAGEKALKAYCLFKGFDVVRTHSLFQIVRSLGEGGALEGHARELDLYYVRAATPTRSLPGHPSRSSAARRRSGRRLRPRRWWPRCARG